MRVRGITMVLLLSTTGLLGSAVPIAPNTMAAGRAQNRRLEPHRTN